MNNNPRHIFITGGARSGKSKFAEELVASIGRKIIYLATAEAWDREMEERISKHQQRRPADWMTIEEPIKVKEILVTYQEEYTILFDCLTMFLSNLYFKFETNQNTEKIPNMVQQEIEDLAKIISASKANLVVVSNEVGWGIVPDNQLSRSFRDLAGIANQFIAGISDEVYLVASGIPVKIKGAPDDSQS